MGSLGLLPFPLPGQSPSLHFLSWLSCILCTLQSHWKNQNLSPFLVADLGRTPPDLSADVLPPGPVHLVEALNPTPNSSHL